MRVRWRIEALPAWPYPDTEARQSSGVFRAGWDDTLRLLRDEADQVGAAESILLQLVCDATDLRQDGMLRARAQVRHPGVIVTLSTERGPLVFGTDQYEHRWSGYLLDWQANVRAIALGMGALRAVDRYGITRRAEQYAGFRALPAAGSPPEFDTTDEALRWLREVTCLSASVAPERVIKRARSLLHPDRHGGDRTGWDRLDAAEQLLTTTTRR